MSTVINIPVIGEAIAISSFPVPLYYKHNTQIDHFVEEVAGKNEIEYLDPKLTSKNFSKIRNELIPGIKYRKSLFPICSIAENEECVDFLHRRESLLVGPQGLTLAQELSPKFFPVDIWVAAVIKNDEAFFNGKYHMTLMIKKCLNGSFFYSLAPAEGQWYNIHYLFGVFPP